MPHFRGKGQLGHIKSTTESPWRSLACCSASVRSSHRVTRGILSTSTDHRPAPPGPEKSTLRIYRFTLDWLSHICTPINTFTALLMPLLGINKVTADKMRLRFSWHLGQHRQGSEEGGVMSEKGGSSSYWGWALYSTAKQPVLLHTDRVFHFRAELFSSGWK